MIEFTRKSPSEEYTRGLGEGLAAALRFGDVLALHGELGSGKTTLTRAIAGAAGADPALVASPTFVLVHEYPVPPGGPMRDLAGGRLIHVDAYRLTGPEDLEPLGWDRMLNPATGMAAEGTVMIVEWPDRIAAALPAPEHIAHVHLAAVGSASRRIKISLPDAWADRPNVEWLRLREPTRCRKTGRWVSPTSPTYPFFDDRARGADLFGWFSERYRMGWTPTSSQSTDPGSQHRDSRPP